MAIYDPTSRTLTLRILYDGVGLAGKTTTLQGLALRFGQSVVSPQEALGRTLYFDWLDHELPRVADERVRVQIVSVPGQAGFTQRRGLLLGAADAIVVVIDSTKQGLPASLRSLEVLRETLDEAQEPAPALILQINKRDDETAVEMEEVRRLLGEGAELPLFESIAETAEGLILPFSCAVRLAQRRTEILADRGLLVVGEVGVQDSHDLMEGLKRAEEAAPLAADALSGDPSQAPYLQDSFSQRDGLALGDSAFGDEGVEDSRDVRLSLAQEIELSCNALVALPTLEALEKARKLLVQGGVWPPLEGPPLVVETLALAHSRGGFSASSAGTLKVGPWRVEKLDWRCFSSKQEACAVLRDWARRCQEQKKALSAHRWLAVLQRQEEGDPGWFLWQGVRVQPCLQDLAMQRRLGESDETLVLRWVHLAAMLLQGQGMFSGSELKLRGDRHSLGIHRSRPVFVDLLPGFDARSQIPPPLESRQEVWSMVLAALSSSRRNLGGLLQALGSQTFANPALLEAANEVTRVLQRTGETMKAGS